jgi:DNA-binding CsgD family transcriptional regulator
VSGGGWNDRLFDEIRVLASRAPAAVLVAGGPGMGKSHLVARVLAASDDVAVKAVVGCRGLPEGPYVLVRELISALAEASCDGAAAYEVLHIVSAATGRSASHEDDYRVCEAVRKLLLHTASRLRASRPGRDTGTAVLVVVEDVECADTRSRRVMRYAVARPTDGVALILTHTPEAGHAPLGARLGSAASAHVHRVWLDALPEPEVAAWAAETLGTAPSEAWVNAVHELTAGVPLFVREVLARVSPEDADPAQALARRGVPQLIAETVRERLGRLPVKARRTVAVAALLRGPVEVSLLARACRTAPATVESRLLRAVDAGVMSREGAGVFGFRPPVVGVAVAQCMPVADRSRWHAAIAAALEQEDSDAALRELVFHTYAAGDVTGAARYAERAAERAVRAGDTAEAIDLLKGLLAEPALPGRARAALAGRLGHLALTSLAYEETVAMLRSILTDDRLPDGLRGELRLHLGLLLCNQAGDGDTGRVELTRAVRELRRRPAPAARAMSALALPYWGSCPLEEHLWWLERAQRTVPVRGDAAMRTAVAVNRAGTLMEIGDPDAWEVAAGLPKDGATASERQQLVRGYTNLADASVSLGHHAAAADFLARAEDLAGCAGSSTYPRHLAAATRLRLAWATGAWSGLAEQAHRHLATARQTPFAASDAYLVLGQLALARGEWDEAEEFLRAPGLHAGSGWHGPQVTIAAALRIRLALARDQLPAALAETARTTQLIRGKGVWTWAAELVDAAVEALLRGGERRAAQELADEFAVGIASRDCPFGQAMLRHCHGAIAAADGPPEEAAALHTEAATLLAALPRPYEQARALEAAGRLLAGAARGPSPAAGPRCLADAARLFSALGASHEGARCARLLRDHGGTADGGPGRRGYGGRLSPREREVGRLIELGRTNRQIADVLFLSPRTVERHAAGVMRKLGVSARDEVRMPEDD